MDPFTQITQLDSAELDKFFEETPSSTPTADNLVVGKEEEGVVVTNNGAPGLESIPEVTDEIFNEIEGVIPDKEKKEAEEKATEEKGKEGSEEKTIDEKEISTFLKNNVDYLVESGLWADFEGREDLEITQEVYAELATKQAQHTAYEIVNELIDSTGDYGKAIISHIKAGGDPDEIIDLFKEQKALDQIDVSTEQGKQVKIEKYYKDVLGWKDEKVKKHINRLITDNEVDTEFNEVEELFEEHFGKKLQESQQETIRQQELAREKQQKFVTSIKSTLDSDTSLTAKDKQVIASSILDFRHKLDNGQKVNDFYLKFAEMQADPKEYVELVRFVMDKENYKKSMQQKANTKAAKEIFDFIKGNTTIGKKQTTDLKLQESGGKPTQKGTNFTFALRKQN